MTGPPVLFCCPVGARRTGQRRKEWQDEAAEDAHDAHDDTERGDTMMKVDESARAMLTIGETITLVEAGMHERRTMLFHRKKQREKQRT
jgi:hypothetical protein